MITTVIFDLDGLLADTEQLHFRAYQLALRENDVQLAEADYGEHWVRRGKGSMTGWRARVSISTQWDCERAKRNIIKFCSDPRFDRWLSHRALARLQGAMRIGLASSSYRDAVDGVLQGLGMASYFETIVSGSEVTRVKPAPDIFLKAANRLGVAPAECVVLEDAEKGVLAAQAAGMPCIAVPNGYTRDHDFSQATQICASLNQVTVELLRNLGKTS